MPLICLALTPEPASDWLIALLAIALLGVIAVSAMLYAMLTEARRMRAQAEKAVEQMQSLVRQTEKAVQQIGEIKSAGAQAAEILGQVGIQNALSFAIAHTACDTAESAKRAARAAENSALATINSERGWVLADLAWQERAKLTETVSGGAPSTVAMVRLLYSNRGKTPCSITEIVARFEIRDALDPVPDLSCGVVRNVPEALPVSDKPRELSLELQAGGRRIYAGNKGLMAIYGTVRYRDVFNESRETRFGYTIDSSTFALERIVGFPDYNTHT